jgi:phenylpropionate dioxygenase-like ring-hydroxylating dioxygenase large terminal subunit
MQAWQIVCRASELGRRPRSFVVGGRPVVVFRAGDDGIGALEDRCAHRNAPLSMGSVCSGRLRCAYHGWEYDADGRVAHVPALPEAAAGASGLRVPRHHALEQQGFVWIALGEASPARRPPEFPHYREPGWTSFVMKNRFRATVEACLENFLDCPHATFVHRYWFRAPTARPVRAVVRTLEDGAVAEFFEEPRRKSVVWSLLAPRGGDMQHTDRFVAPAMSRVDYRFPSGLHYIISSSCTEIGPAETEVYTVISFRFGRLGPLVRLYFEPLSRLIIAQDVKILAAQQGNVERFGGARFASTRADLLAPHIAAWREALKAGKAPPAAGTEQHVEIRL